MEGVRRGPPNAARHHGEVKEEEEEAFWANFSKTVCVHLQPHGRFPDAMDDRNTISDRDSGICYPIAPTLFRTASCPVLC
jgi:hypothetical protein